MARQLAEAETSDHTGVDTWQISTVDTWQISTVDTRQISTVDTRKISMMCGFPLQSESQASADLLRNNNLEPAPLVSKLPSVCFYSGSPKTYRDMIHQSGRAAQTCKQCLSRIKNGKYNTKKKAKIWNIFLQMSSLAGSFINKLHVGCWLFAEWKWRHICKMLCQQKDPQILNYN